MDEESDDGTRCPFCGEADGCEHLVASSDHGNHEIAGGILFAREEANTSRGHALGAIHERR